jgi:tetratricopeptide (TPR) repeat protein
MSERYAALGRALRVPDGVEMPRAGDTAAHEALAARHRGSYPVQMAAGQALAAAGLRDAAFAAFARASELVPSAVGPDSPHARMADLAEKSGDRPRALRELRTLLALDHDNVDGARRLAALAEKAGDRETSRLAYERLVTVSPFEAHAHTALGRMAMGNDKKDLPLALREFRAALAAGPTDVAAARCDLGEALLLAGRRSEAKREVLAALEVAPTYERAQMLLLKIIEG